MRLQYLLDGKGLTTSASRTFASSYPSTDPESLTALISIDGNAPLGQTNLNLLEGSRLRASLPFTVTAAATDGTTPPRDICPDVRIVPGGEFSRDPNTGVLHAVVSVVQATTVPVTYIWSADGDASIYSGQGMPDVVVRFNKTRQDNIVYGSVRVVVGGGWPASCVTSATYSYNTSAPTPQLSVSVEPQSITVCRTNPNTPTAPVVSVRVGLQPPDLRATYGASVSGGKLNDRGFSRTSTPFYEWDLSGVSPGTYTVRVLANAAAGQPQWPRQVQTQTVTVNGCPATGLTSAMLGAAKKTVDDMKIQVAAMNNLKKSMAGNKQITYDEEQALASAIVPLDSTLDALVNSIDALIGNPSAVSAAKLTLQVNAVNSALRNLEFQLAKINDGKAHAQLAAPLDAMKNYSSQLNQLKGPAAIPRDE